MVGMSKLSSNGFYFLSEPGSKEVARSGREDVLGLRAKGKLGGRRDMWNRRAASGTCLSAAVMTYSSVSTFSSGHRQRCQGRCAEGRVIKPGHGDGEEGEGLYRGMMGTRESLSGKGGGDAKMVGQWL